MRTNIETTTLYNVIDNFDDFKEEIKVIPEVNYMHYSFNPYKEDEIEKTKEEILIRFNNQKLNITRHIKLIKEENIINYYLLDKNEEIIEEEQYNHFDKENINKILKFIKEYENPIERKYNYIIDKVSFYNKNSKFRFYYKDDNIAISDPEYIYIFKDKDTYEIYNKETNKKLDTTYNINLFLKMYNSYLKYLKNNEIMVYENDTFINKYKLYDKLSKSIEENNNYIKAKEHLKEYEIIVIMFSLMAIFFIIFFPTLKPSLLPMIVSFIGTFFYLSKLRLINTVENNIDKIKETDDTYININNHYTLYLEERLGIKKDSLYELTNNKHLELPKPKETEIYEVVKSNNQELENKLSKTRNLIKNNKTINNNLLKNYIIPEINNLIKNYDNLEEEEKDYLYKSIEELNNKLENQNTEDKIKLTVDSKVLYQQLQEI